MFQLLYKKFMSINCKNERYKIKNIDDIIYVYDDIYEKPLILLILMSILELLLPDRIDLKVPKTIQINQYDKDILVNENLTVIGSSDFQYIITTNHLKKWRKSFLLVGYMLSIMSAVLLILFTYILINSPTVGLLIPVLVALLFLYLGIKNTRMLCEEVKLYPIIDVKFDI